MTALDIVFFDLDGTLLQNREHFPSVFVRVLGEHGLACDADRVQDAVRKLRPWYEERVGAHPKNEIAFWFGFNRQVCEALGAGARAEELGRVVTKTFRSLDTPTLYDDVLPCLDRFAKTNTRLGVITARPDARRVLTPLGIVGRFELLVDAFDAGSAKQDPSIYAHALARARVNPAKALHVGDQYTRDVLPARSLGLHVVLLDRADASPEADCPRIRSLLELPDLTDKL